jgi:hypothetical protein
MVAYALLLRPLGFLLATVAFSCWARASLGERRFHVLIPVAASRPASSGTWSGGARHLPAPAAGFLG